MVKIQGTDSNYYLELIDCDASESTIFSSRTCSVATTTLTGAPYSLVWGSGVSAEVTAVNPYGDSTPTTGDGALIITSSDPPIFN